MILVDTSIWVELLNGHLGEELDGDIAERFVTCGPVVQEVLQGLRPSAVRKFQAYFGSLPRLLDPLPERIFIQAAEIYRLGRQSGYTIRTPHDCLIAAIAIEADVPVWHRDQDFDFIARYTELKIHERLRAAN